MANVFYSKNAISKNIAKKTSYLPKEEYLQVHILNGGSPMTWKKTDYYRP
jgi:hypothetical protein